MREPRATRPYAAAGYRASRRRGCAATLEGIGLKTLIVGVGSEIRSDDGVGIHVTRELRRRLYSEKVDFVELGTAGLGLLDSIAEHERLIIIDAILTGATPGTVHLLRGADIARATHLGPGHDADLPTVLALGDKLTGGRMPREVLVVAIEAADLSNVSTELTPAVAAAVHEAATTVKALLESESATEA